MSPTTPPAPAAPAPPPEVVEAALKEAERVAKKQKTCAARSSDALTALTGLVEAARERIAADASCDPAAVLLELCARVQGLGAVAQMTSDTKDLHGAVAKLGKAVDRGFSTDVCTALRAPPLDRRLLDQVVAEHLYHEGAFEAGDALVAEAGVGGGGGLKAPYAAMHGVLQQLDARNLEPALAWAARHAGELRAAAATSAAAGGPSDLEFWLTSASAGPSDLEFWLHRLRFLQTLELGGQAAALQYARAHLAQFRHTHLAEVQRLMGALCYARRAAAGRCAARYADLFSGAPWAGLRREFVRQACAMLGQAQDSPLLVAVAAGAAALPTLLKLSTLVAQTGAQLDSGDQPEGQLPVEVPLGREFVFHSVFACPVSREQSTPDNPPVMLPCGHCMCRATIARIARSASRAFKCPYCPAEATPQQCVELRFPETCTYTYTRLRGAAIS